MVFTMHFKGQSVVCQDAEEIVQLNRKAKAFARESLFFLKGAVWAYEVVLRTIDGEPAKHPKHETYCDGLGI